MYIVVKVYLLTNLKSNLFIMPGLTMQTLLLRAKKKLLRDF